LDVKIFELREDPSNVDLLVEVLASICFYIESNAEQPEILQPIKDLDLVNYVLASALKID